jgi:AcrR family transcriptional regulator
MPDTVVHYEPPRQQRSRQSLERYLDAAEAIIRESGFDNLTLVEVVRRAGYSVGGFYSRFANKDGLLAAVQSRFLARTEAALSEKLDAEPEMHESLEDAVRRIVDILASQLLGEPELFRAFIVQGTVNRDAQARAEQAYRARGERVIAALLVHQDEIAHPDPSLAAAFVYEMCMAILRERVVYGPTAALMGRLPDDVLIGNLTKALTYYLRMRPT